jgi:hypothetical protein
MLICGRAHRALQHFLSSGPGVRIWIRFQKTVIAQLVAMQDPGTNPRHGNAERRARATLLPLLQTSSQEGTSNRLQAPRDCDSAGASGDDAERPTDRAERCAADAAQDVCASVYELLSFLLVLPNLSHLRGP